MGSGYVDAGDGQCLAVKDSDGQRCTNGVRGTNLVCGIHINASDVTYVDKIDEREYYWCRGCGFQPGNFLGGGEAVCSQCGVEFPGDRDSYEYITPDDDFEIEDGQPVLVGDSDE